MSLTLEDVIASKKMGYFTNRGIIACNLILVLALLSSFATGFDGTMLNGLQSLEPWEAYFGYPTGTSLAILNAIPNIGQVASVPFSAIVSDKWGRRMGVFSGSILMLLGIGLQTGATGTGMFIGARFLIGFGLGISITAAPLLILEMAYPSQRTTMTSLYNSVWGFGATTAAWITFGTFRMNSNWSWRLPALLQGAASIVQVALIFFVPESPRWLIDQGRVEEAQALITKYHANGDVSDPIIALEVQEIEQACVVDREINANTTYLNFFKTVGNRRRLLIVVCVGFFSQWSGTGLITYYLSIVLTNIGITGAEEQTRMNGILNTYCWVVSMIGAFVVDRIRRRTAFIGCGIAMLFCFIAWTIAEARYEMSVAGGSPNNGAGKAVLAFIFLMNGVFNLIWQPIQVVYIIEILPLSLRARGLAIYNLTVSAALVFNQYANPVMLEKIEWRTYVVYSVWLAVELAVIYFYFVETSNLSLEETAALLDGTSAVERIHDAGTEATYDPTAARADEKDEKEMGVVGSVVPVV